MSEVAWSDQREQQDQQGERTGVRAVDDVIDSVTGLHERPLDEHAAVFENAHEQLRRALDPGEPDPSYDA